MVPLLKSFDDKAVQNVISNQRVLVEGLIVVDIESSRSAPIQIRVGPIEESVGE